MSDGGETPDLDGWGAADDDTTDEYGDHDTDPSTGQIALGREVEEADSTLYYANVDEFVREQIVPVFRRNVGQKTGMHRWSAEWWRNPEAVIRLQALWRAWETLRLDPGVGTSVWLRDHADHHLAILLSPEGPFRRSRDEATIDEPLPYAQPPAGLFPDER